MLYLPKQSKENPKKQNWTIEIKHICTEKGATIQQWKKESNEKMVKLFVIKLSILSIIILEGNKVQT